MSGGFQILFVCTGNICRSASAQQFLKAKVKKTGVRIQSAGTHALENADMPPQAQQIQDELGTPPTIHRSKRLTSELLEQSQLVLTATAEHRSDVARTLVRANRYTFTILEFADIIEFLNNPGETDFDIEAESPSLQHRLQQSVAARGYINSEKNRDIQDPFTKDITVYREVGTQLDRATTIIADWVNA
jgi:protein-tyrosine phosphatase